MWSFFFKNRSSKEKSKVINETEKSSEQRPIVTPPVTQIPSAPNLSSSMSSQPSKQLSFHPSMYNQYSHPIFPHSSPIYTSPAFNPQTSFPNITQTTLSNPSSAPTFSQSNSHTHPSIHPVIPQIPNASTPMYSTSPITSQSSSQPSTHSIIPEPTNPVIQPTHSAQLPNPTNQSMAPINASVIPNKNIQPTAPSSNNSTTSNVLLDSHRPINITVQLKSDKNENGSKKEVIHHKEVRGRGTKGGKRRPQKPYRQRNHYYTHYVPIQMPLPVQHVPATPVYYNAPQAPQQVYHPQLTSQQVPHQTPPQTYYRSNVTSWPGYH